MQPQREHEICRVDYGCPDVFHGEFSSDDHERLEWKREIALRYGASEERYESEGKAQEAKMRAWLLWRGRSFFCIVELAVTWDSKLRSYVRLL
jgi:hypothetical protein